MSMVDYFYLINLSKELYKFHHLFIRDERYTLNTLRTLKFGRSAELTTEFYIKAYTNVIYGIYNLIAFL